MQAVQPRQNLLVFAGPGLVGDRAVLLEALQAGLLILLVLALQRDQPAQ